MKHISDLFSKYTKTITPPQSSIIKVFVEVVHEELGFSLKTAQCDYTVSSKTLYLKVPSLLKTEILLQKNNLLSRLQQKLGHNAPTEIL